MEAVPIEGAGDSTHVERRDAFVEAVAGFLGRLGVAAGVRHRSDGGG